MENRIYIAIADDSTTDDAIVFAVHAENPKEVRSLVQGYYESHDWQGQPRAIKVEKVRDDRAVQYIGHTNWLSAQRQAEELATRLLDIAQGGSVNNADLYDLVAQYKIGREVMKKRGII